MCSTKNLQIVNPNTKSVNNFLKDVTHKDKAYWIGLTIFMKLKSDIENSKIHELALKSPDEIMKRKLSYWIGVEAYIMKPHKIEIIYWKWNNTGIDVAYHNWCPNQNTKAKDLLCAYASARSKCEKDNAVGGVICENKMPQTDEYDVVIYKGSKYLVYHKDNKKKSWYDVRDKCRSMGKSLLSLDSNDKNDFFNRIFHTRNMSNCLGRIRNLRSNNTWQHRYIYWRWAATERDISYKYWCPHSEVVKEAMCGYIALDPMCWMAERCTNKDVNSFVCEAVTAATHHSGGNVEHYSAVAYHKHS
uniref:C-type lectin domain-containing protein n=1 Tax=Strigamia maritima TaxID=126957 RepID=T1J7K5_STRMM